MKMMVKKILGYLLFMPMENAITSNEFTSHNINYDQFKLNAGLPEIFLGIIYFEQKDSL